MVFIEGKLNKYSMKTTIWDANGMHHHYWDEENRLENTENKYKELQATAAYQAIFQEFADYYTAICDDFYLAKFNEDMHYHQTPETALYFYHPDHLGSASWITDSSGKAIQHSIMNDNDQQLYDAINSTNVTVNIEADDKLYAMVIILEQLMMQKIKLHPAQMESIFTERTDYLPLKKINPEPKVLE
jgi:hypothetical protein